MDKRVLNDGIVYMMKKAVGGECGIRKRDSERGDEWVAKWEREVLEAATAVWVLANYPDAWSG